MSGLSTISSRQIKAARALLDWSQDDLAQASQLSVATIRKLELGYISPRCSTTSVILKAFEASGIEFTASEGVRRRREDIAIFQGAGGCVAFMEDIAETAHKNGGDIMIVATSALGPYYMFGAKTGQLLEDIVGRNSRIAIKVILTDAIDLPGSLPRLEYRSLSTNYVNPMPFCVYGDKFAMITSSEGRVMKIVVVQSTSTAQSSRRQFSSMWEKAMAMQPATPELNGRSMAAGAL